MTMTAKKQVAAVREILYEKCKNLQNSKWTKHRNKVECRNFATDGMILIKFVINK